MKFLLSALTLSVLATSVYADDAIPCKKPVIPNPQASDTVIKMFNKRYDAYKVCIKKYVDEQHAIVDSEKDKNMEKARSANDAAEAAIKDYNAFSEEAQAAFPPQEDKDK
ncbi:MAG: hypothetical protein JO269_13190 [Burkholderiaceae bacterium]|nr:hypothetical protein [Burkholderiaceae bacterium]